MHSKLVACITFLSLVTSSLSHGGVTSIGVGGTIYQGWQPFLAAAGQVTAGRPYSSYNPILSATDPTLHCNDDGTPGPDQQTITIAAGSVITDYYTQWTHLPGPYTVYLAACPSSGCSTVNTGTVKWFKIYELGLISGTVYDGQWANGLLEANLYWQTTIPANLLPGYYFIRWETLALHQADTPQWYPECAQLQITGSGTAFPTSEYLVSIPGAWQTSDPGVTIDIYSTAAQTQTTYLIPGPRVYPGFSGYAPPPNLPGGSGTTTAAGTTAPGSTTTGKSSSTTTAKTTSTSTSTSAAPSGTGQAAHYGQCGGIGWAGPTVCVSPYVCTPNGAYYSQCL